MTYQFDHRELRDVLGSFVTGVTVVTTVDGAGCHHGLTVNSFSSVSLDPPLVLWSQSNSSPSHPVFSKSGRFVINILAEDQVDLSNRFARSGPDKFANLVVDVGAHGLPILKDTSAWLACKLVSAIPGGDHTIFIGEVEQIDRDAGLEQRVFHQRQHRIQLGPREIERLEVLEAPRAEHPALERLPTRRQLGKKTLRVDARQRSQRGLAWRGHVTYYAMPSS